MKNKNKIFDYSYTAVNPVTDEEVEVTLKLDYYNDPGIMYETNGDPGYPPETSLEVLSHDGPDWLTNQMISRELDNLDVEAYLDLEVDTFNWED